jgi:hypothetical protein
MDRQVPLKLDLSWYATQSKRDFKLDRFKIKAELASNLEIQNITHTIQRDLFSRFFNLIQRLLPYYRQRLIIERAPGFDLNILTKTSRSAYLDGYWQSEKYFSDIQEVIRKEFTLKSGLSPQSLEVAKDIGGNNSVGMHFRRGDYVSSDETRKYHGECSARYYEKCVKMVAKKVNRPHFFIFSDEPSWVTENLKINYPTTIVDHNGIEEDYEDLILMSRCKHFVIANSSFSWWGAWLGSFPNKIVVAPQKWFNDASLNTKDLIPESWIRIKDE